MKLKTISAPSVARALSLAERYRLLNEPDQAASICRDVLDVEPRNQEALRMLLLSLTDQFADHGASLQEAEATSQQLESEYERAYYRGVAYERWGRSVVHGGAPVHVAGQWLTKAMEKYEEAETLRPAGDDSALLRWNACARLLNRDPALAAERVAEPVLGD